MRSDGSAREMWRRSGGEAKTHFSTPGLQRGARWPFTHRMWTGLSRTRSHRRATTPDSQGAKVLGALLLVVAGMASCSQKVSNKSELTMRPGDNEAKPPHALVLPEGGRFDLSCTPGFEARGAECADIDECAQNHGGCDALTTCTNTPGGFTCGACPKGYTGTGTTGCRDIDECAVDNGGCDARTTCLNTAGGFTCGHCPSGYAGTGKTGCTDIDECATSNGG
ncbi:MAG: hypothetical protein J0I07_07140, partial [Myxococcales bacterium]|nr:hypothetical protein [Myxococcales bacterium]